ncbi:MAG: nucleoside transporter C-terminal domain-containing protein, partial [Myxococcota bacterium]
ILYNTSSLNDLQARAKAAGVAIPEGCVKPKDSDAQEQDVTSCAYRLHATLLVHQATTRGLELPKACSAEHLSARPKQAPESCIAQLTPALGADAETASIWYVPTFQDILGVLFWPIAFIMGVPISECWYIGQLLGSKVILNELVAYSELVEMLKNPAIQLSERSVVIATYALCGFANLGSIAIQIGGIGGIAPNRRKDLAELGLKAMFAGVLAACMTATIAGILV